MIRSFKEKMTEAVFNGQQPKGLPADIFKTAQRKLAMINAAASLDDLKVPPGNRLEPLKGDRKGQFSIRINDQYRICFAWTPEGPELVEIIDYHRG